MSDVSYNALKKRMPVSSGHVRWYYIPEEGDNITAVCYLGCVISPWRGGE